MCRCETVEKNCWPKLRRGRRDATLSRLGDVACHVSTKNLVRRPATRVAGGGLDRWIGAEHDFNRIRDHGVGVVCLAARQLNFFGQALGIGSVLRLAASFGEFLCTLLVAGLAVRSGGVLKTKFRLDLVPAGILLFGYDETAICDSRISKRGLCPAGV